jgi:hypothetical protein
MCVDDWVNNFDFSVPPPWEATVPSIGQHLPEVVRPEMESPDAWLPYSGGTAPFNYHGTI